MAKKKYEDYLKELQEKSKDLKYQPSVNTNKPSKNNKQEVINTAKKNNIAIDENNPLLMPTIQSVSMKNNNRYTAPASGFSSIEQQNRNQLQEEQENFKKKVQNTLAYENYKKEVEERQKNSKSLDEKIIQATKNILGGAWGGITNLANSATSELKNDIKKAKKEGIAKNVLDLMSATRNITNPASKAVTYVTDTAKNAYNSATDKDKTTKQKLGAFATKQGTLGTNLANPILPAANESAQVASNIIGAKNSEKVYKGIEKVENKINTPVEEYNRKLQEENAEYGKGTQYLFSALNQVGNMIPSIATTAVTKNPQLGLEVMGSSAKGASIKEALAKGADLEQAIDIGNTKGAIEKATEMISGGVNIFGKGAIDDIVERGINKAVKNEVANFLIKRGIVDNAGEIAEETISDILGTLIDQGTVDQNAKYSIKDWSNTAITTVLSTLALNALTGGYGPTSFKQNAANIAQQTALDNINFPTAENTQGKNLLKNENNNINLPSINQYSKQEQGIDNYYKHEKSDNVKIDNLRKDVATLNWANDEKTNNYMNMLEQIIKDKDVEIRFDSNLKDNNGNVANGKYENGVITINPNSNRAGEFIAIHELTHAIGTDSMRKIVENYRKSNAEFDNNAISMPKSDKTMNPNEISKLTQKDADTTPKIPIKNRNVSNDGDSKFWDNILYKTDMLSSENKKAILSDEEVKKYDKVTNKESLEKAYEKLNKDGAYEANRWFRSDSKDATATDVAEGWILLKQYADRGDTQGMVEVAKKMRDIGTKAGQTVQAFNIMERMTPEGMVAYAQSELSEAYDNMIKNKSKAWIDKHKGDFELKPDEVQFIMDNMQEISKMEDGYDKRVKLAEIQKMMTDKLPVEKGRKIKSWMRISMLFNPKTQVRNVAGNAIIMPVNSFGDLFATYADKVIAKKSGVRTTGMTNVKALLKGIKKGAYEATNDFRKGINTRDMEGNRFEIGEGKSFSNKNLMGKSLNRVDGMLNYIMDVGDRVFSEAAFENSLQNQMKLNNTTEITQDMIDIARSEALQRTWNDNNNYTRFVLNVRKGLNKIGVKGYGLGDVLIPFAKTPANLTKAIVDYSPAGLVKTIVEGNNLRKALNNGQYTPQMQHQFVQDLGRATAGTMLYVLGAALAKSGVISGESDDDKDTKDFLKNTLGVNSYSIKIGDKSFTYDWAQPIAAPLSIMANIENKKDKEETALLEATLSSLDSASSILLEQSFLQSVNEVLTNNKGIASGIENVILDLPARSIPTFLKQLTDLTDSTQRQTFEYNQPLKTAVNKFKAKIPGLSETLAPKVDSMGREVQKYGGKNNFFNIFLNPANVNTENISEGAEEIYRLYKETGEKDIMPKVAPYYINQKDGEKIILNTKEIAEYQKISGDIVESSMKDLLNSTEYQNMSDTEKAEVVKDIVNYANNIAKNEVTGIELSKSYQKAYDYSKIGDVKDYYLLKDSIDKEDSSKEKKQKVVNYLMDSNLTNKQLAYLYGNYYSSEEELDNILNAGIPMKQFIKLDSQDFEGVFDESKGRTKTNSKKEEVLRYIDTLKLTADQKAFLAKSKYSSVKGYDRQITQYIRNRNLSLLDQYKLLKYANIDTYDKEIVNYIANSDMSQSKKEKLYKEMGFTVYNGRVYVK